MRFLLPLLFFATFATLTAQQPPKREMRAVWIATVANIDWPAHKTMPADSQMLTLRTMLDTLHSAGINTVIFQARPAADALYRSSLEPWSAYLSGKQGVAPDSLPYDPLDSLITLAHQRCMEAHVWINPYRAAMTDKTATLDSLHPYFKHPDWFLKYGGKLYFNPAIDSVRFYLLDVVADLVTRYDIDALVMDDYFYPYPVPKQTFPDLKFFKANPRGFKTIGDWRRDNVNRTIQALSNQVHTLKPWVHFGISPFGVWRHKTNDPRGSNSRKGLQNYDDLYADVLFWLNNDYLDYVSPQLYWELGHHLAPYEELLPWWNDNKRNANLYISMYASGVSLYKKNPAWQQPSQLAKQMTLNRQPVHNSQKRFDELPCSGQIFYSAKFFARNEQGFLDSLRANFYHYPALPPVSHIIAHTSDAYNALRTSFSKKEVSFTRIKRGHDLPDSVRLDWQAATSPEQGKQVSYYVVYATAGKKAADTSDPTHIVTITSTPSADISDFCATHQGRFTFTITAVNRFRVESLPEVHITRKL